MSRFSNARDLEEEIEKLLHYCKNNTHTSNAISKLQKHAHKTLLDAAGTAPCSVKYSFLQNDESLMKALIACYEYPDSTYTLDALHGVLYEVLKEEGQRVQRVLREKNQNLTITAHFLEDRVDFSVLPTGTHYLSLMEELLGDDAF